MPLAYFTCIDHLTFTIYMRLGFIFIGFAFLLVSCQKEELQKSPILFTRAPTNITLNSVTLEGELSQEGSSAVTTKGFVFSSRVQNPTLNDSKVELGPGKGVFSVVLDKLTTNTKYYFKAYATHENGTTYGEVKSFTTAGYSLASLSTDVPKSIGYTSVNLSGIVTNDGGGTVSERGFVVGENPTPTVLDLKFSALSAGLGAFSLFATTLNQSTKYYVRAYAVNEKGISYGNTHNFTTAALVLATVFTDKPLLITFNSVRLGGAVTNDGGSTIKEIGICYGLKPNPTLADFKVLSGLDIGTFVVDIRDLRDNTTYYYRSYVINSTGTAFGNEQFFKTLPIN